MAAGNVKGGIQRDLQGDLDAIAQKAKDPEIKNFFNAFVLTVFIYPKLFYYLVIHKLQLLNELLQHSLIKR